MRDCCSCFNCVHRGALVACRLGYWPPAEKPPAGMARDCADADFEASSTEGRKQTIQTIKADDLPDDLRTALERHFAGRRLPVRIYLGARSKPDPSRVWSIYLQTGRSIHATAKQTGHCRATIRAIVREREAKENQERIKARKPNVTNGKQSRVATRRDLTARPSAPCADPKLAHDLAQAAL